MNLQQPNANEATETRNRSRDVAPSSGLCTRCMESCPGNCEVFQASIRGRELIYPRPFGEITAGCDKKYPIDYSHLNIMGYALGAEAIDETNPDKVIFPEVDTSTVYGHTHPVLMKAPIFTGALGSTDIARKHWDSCALGAAISGISVVVGENVCGVDPAVGHTYLLPSVRGPRLRAQAGFPGPVGAGPCHGGRFLIRGPSLQGARHGSTVLQGRLHGACLDDSGLRRRQHRGCAEER